MSQPEEEVDMKFVGLPLVVLSAGVLSACGSEPIDNAEPDTNVADGVEYDSGPSETMPATAPGPDERPAAKVDTERAEPPQ